MFSLNIGSREIEMIDNPKVIDVKSLDNGNCLVYWEDNTITEHNMQFIPKSKRKKYILQILNDYNQRHKAGAE